MTKKKKNGSRSSKKVNVVFLYVPIVNVPAAGLFLEGEIILPVPFRCKHCPTGGTGAQFVYLHLHMDSSPGQRVRHFFQYVNPSGHDAVPEVVSNVHVVAVDLVLELLPIVHDPPQMVHVFISELPLVVRVVFEHFETLVDPVLNAHQTADDKYNACISRRY